MKTLLIVGSPRSLTTHVGHVVAESTGLVNLQEVFNVDHPYARPVPIGHRDRSQDGYLWIRNFILSRTRGHILKDVVQPIHVSRFLDEYQDAVNAVYIHRWREAILTCQRRWGMIAADPLVYEELYRFTPRLEFDRLIEDAGYLHEFLLGCGYDGARRVEYITPEFAAYSQEVAERSRVDYTIRTASR